MSMDELAGYTVLMQGNRSGSGVYLSKWLLSQGIVFPNVLTSDNLVALAGLAVAGLGVTYLPRHCFDRLVDDGKLSILKTQLALPAVPYAAMYRNDRPSKFVTAVADLTRQCCDFSQQFAG
jgi:DNA-binding transcriptional LysR family regulator